MVLPTTAKLRRFIAPPPSKGGPPCCQRSRPPRRRRRDRARPRGRSPCPGGRGQRAAILPRDPDRVATALGEAAVLDDPRLGRDRAAQPARETAPHGLPRPRALIDELLQTLLIAVGPPGRHRLDRF